MSEEKKYPSYNINVGSYTETSSLLEIKTFKYHPYGLENFRKNIIEHVDEWQSKGLSWNGHDQLTHAWRTPWDMNLRHEELMSPILSMVLGIINNNMEHGDEFEWFVKDCWISEYRNQSAANKHDHGIYSFGFSFCYYVEMPDSGPGFSLCDDVDNHIKTLNVTTGDLLIFRHPLKHQVFPALDRRIIISGNVCLDESKNVISQQKYYNENYQNENPILVAKHSKVDVDNWNISVVDQKLGGDVGIDEGY